jgi:hypothetical protein
LITSATNLSHLSPVAAVMLGCEGLLLALGRIDDPEEASAGLAELRAYGGLLEAGFKCTPIPVKDDSTPDFEVDAGDGPVIVEVFAKHQDESETKL